MKRIKLTVAYDGTNYHGWQVQPNAVTIEGKLNEAISELTKETIQVIGASRTDAGVHALGNVAVFDTESRIPGGKFSYALNQRLPDDIVIQQSQEVDKDFHPRYCTCEKTYEYVILNRKFPLPEYRNTAFFYYGDLDIKAMQEATKAFLGEHDFAGFCSAGAQVKTTVRTIYELTVEKKDNDMICIRVRGNGFGKGNIEAKSLENRIAAADRSQAGPTAPARGLKLIRIQYISDPASCTQEADR